MFSSCAVWLPGCGGGPEYVIVTGRVTLDGEPLEHAFVRFIPEMPSDATTAFGKTDANGEYELLLSDSHKGILPGTFMASISTADEFADESGTLQRIPERVPPQYNVRTTLTTLEVPPGEATVIDFELETSSQEAVQTVTR